MNQLIPSRGQLPEFYRSAQAALAQCAKVDECKTWADKAEAIASYARMAGDKKLMQCALRIKARATKRCGVLLLEFDAKQGLKRAGTNPLSPRDRAAKEAGLSKGQRKQAQRVAAYSEADPNGYEQAIESDNPATITELARRGTRKKPKTLFDLGGRSVKDFQAATALMGALGFLHRYTKEPPNRAAAIRGLSKKEHTVTLKEAKHCAAFLASLIKELSK